MPLHSAADRPTGARTRRNPPHVHPHSRPRLLRGGAPQGQPGWDAPQQEPYPQQQSYPPPQQQQPYAQQQPYQQPGYQPAPSYSGGPTGYGAPSGQRPQPVLIAAILGFVVAAFMLIGALGLFALSTLLGIFALFAVLYLVLAALNIWGGIQALSGKNSNILKIAGLITAGLSLLGIIVSLTQGSFSIWSLLSVAAGLGIFMLLNQPVSQQWFAAHGTR
jgi:hypothetical protein